MSPCIDSQFNRTREMIQNDKLTRSKCGFGLRLSNSTYLETPRSSHVVYQRVAHD